MHFTLHCAALLQEGMPLIDHINTLSPSFEDLGMEDPDKMCDDGSKPVQKNCKMFVQNVHEETFLVKPVIIVVIVIINNKLYIAISLSHSAGFVLMYFVAIIDYYYYI